MLVGIALLLIAGAGAAAVVLVKDQDDSEPARSSAAADDRPAPAPPPSEEPAPAPSPSEEPAPAPAPSEEPAPAPAPAADDTPAAALREHWQAIDAHDYAAAYDRFSSRYRAGHELDAWSAGIKRASPDVEVVETELIESSGDEATVRVVLATRDRGPDGDASRCHIFAGRVRVVRQQGRWLYDPPGLRETPAGGIDPASDDRCAPLFA